MEGLWGENPPRTQGQEPPPSCEPVPKLLSLAMGVALKVARRELGTGSKGLTGCSPIAKAMQAKQGSVMVQTFPPSCSGQLRGRELLDKPSRGRASKGPGAAEATPLITDPLLGCIALAKGEEAIGLERSGTWELTKAEGAP